MALIEAVLFDYGLVLSGPQDPAAIARASALIGEDRKRFEALYWAQRDAYDCGKLTGPAYWRTILRAAGRVATPALLRELIRLDGQIWLTENPPLLEWQSGLRARGIRSAILSNMGDAMQQRIEQHCAWIDRFDVRVWSNAVGFTKPDPRIFAYTLDQLGVPACRALFLDDRLENILAAKALGIAAIHFTSFDACRQQLTAWT